MLICWFVEKRRRKKIGEEKTSWECQKWSSISRLCFYCKIWRFFRLYLGFIWLYFHFSCIVAVEMMGTYWPSIPWRWLLSADLVCCFIDLSIIDFYFACSLMENDFPFVRKGIIRVYSSLVAPQLSDHLRFHLSIGPRINRALFNQLMNGNQYSGSMSIVILAIKIHKITQKSIFLFKFPIFCFWNDFNRINKKQWFLTQKKINTMFGCVCLCVCA